MTRILISTGIVAASFATLFACKSDIAIIPDVVTPVPEEAAILVTPPALQFGTLQSDQVEVLTFQIESVGQAPLDVTDITIEDSDAFTILSGTTYNLPEGEMVEIEVEFAPLGIDNVGLAVVHSNVPNEPETLVQLNGFGTVPELTITPDVWDFGTRFIPCEDMVTLTLENTGTDLLTIEAIGQVSDIDFQLVDNNTLPLTLDPGQNTTVDVIYTPAIEGTTSATLEVLSNDPRGLVTAGQTGTAQYAAFTHDQHTVPIDPPVDIIFAVDQSCSMDSRSTQLANNFNTFITQIDTATNGWQIGIADVGTINQPLGAAGCFVNGAINNSTPNYQSVFQSAVTYGDDSSGTETYSEYLTELIDITLSKTNPGGCNSGFLRPGALLHIVLVSDEYNHTVQPWTYYQGNYETYVADPTLLKVSGVIAQGICGGNSGYPGIIQSTGGETIDICAANWAAQLANLGAASLNGVSNFELDNPADGASIQVEVNGTVRTDWSYDANANEVQFDNPLEGGDSVFIEYGISVGCAP